MIAGLLVATTIPVLGLAPGERTVALGLPAAAWDFGVRPGLAIGAAAGWYYYQTHLGVRATWTLAEPRPGLLFGAMLGLGGGSTTFDRPSGYGYLLGAAVAQARLGPMIVRASLGPALTVRPQLVTTTPWGSGATGATTWDLAVLPLPNLELALPLGAAHELTVGGNALVGWRGRW